LLAGFVRLVLVHHATFSINSFAHFFGRQPFSDRDSSRDSFFTAIISMGEGYHNFHHTFPGDYRNGVRGYHYDPTKWILRALATVGMTANLRRTPEPLVLRARIRMQQRGAERRLQGTAIEATVLLRLTQFRASLDQRLDRWRTLAADQRRRARSAEARARESVAKLGAEVRLARQEFFAAYASWKRAARRPGLVLSN
jgi:stearoyl-CoA desaturase (delta-9 desaturase)